MVFPASPNDVTVDKPMEVNTRSIPSFMGEGEYRLGSMQFFSCMKSPSEGGRIQSTEKADFAIRGDFNGLCMVSTVDKIASVAVTLSIVFGLCGEKDTRIMS